MTHRQKSVLATWLPILISLVSMIAIAGVTWGNNQTANEDTKTQVKINSKKIESLDKESANQAADIAVIKNDVGWIRRQMEKK